MSTRTFPQAVTNRPSGPLLPHPGDWKNPILGAVFVIVAFGGLYTFARYLVAAGFKIAFSTAPNDLRKTRVTIFGNLRKKSRMMLSRS